MDNRNKRQTKQIVEIDKRQKYNNRTTIKKIENYKIK